MEELLIKFKKVEESDFPNFYQFEKPLDMGLWVLLVSKDALKIKKLEAEQISLIIRDVKEKSIDSKSINNAFARAKDKVHTYHENGKVFFEIMKPGKDYLFSKIKKELIDLFYFEAGKNYSSKKVLVNHILDKVNGKIKVIDPYLSARTLDILSNYPNKEINILTTIDNLRPQDKSQFLREYNDFKKENPKIEIKDYSSSELHDRYILSENFLIILGHGIKDLGNRDSFVIVLDKKVSTNIIESLTEVFDRRWKQSTPL